MESLVLIVGGSSMLGWKDVSQYDFNIVLLFEEIQLEWLFQWMNHEELSVLLKEYPTVSWFIKNKAPKLTSLVEKLEQQTNKIEFSRAFEQSFVMKLEDWIIYAVDPDAYDKQEFNRWDTSELLSLIDFKQKTVVDIGSGTGSQVFRIAPYAKTIFAVEPVGNLRQYIKDKAELLHYDNIYVVDGTMTSLPYPNNFCDVVVSGHVFGDEIEKEFKEMNRILKPGGMIILIPGNNDKDNEIHHFLLNKGFEFARFLEPGEGMKRKYWYIKR